jgi:GMP synthase (glutamine-hydrolysing)
MGLNVKGVDSGDRFLSELAVSDPETKRKIIGRVLLKF